MISVVMAYYNRLEQLSVTLASLKDVQSDFEIVIVDDFSVVDQSPTQLLSLFPSLNIKVIHMGDVVDEKSYFNPCVPYNVGFRNSTGDKILIQNPECCHVGDVLAYIEANLTNDDYLTFHCYASGIRDKDYVRRLVESNTATDIDVTQMTGKWYNHETLRPVALHFANAITRKNLCRVNGFDERFSQGEWFDDNEFLRRVKLSGLEVRYVESPYVIHQWHSKDGNPSEDRIQTNRTLMHEVMKDPSYFAPNSVNICQ